MLVDVGQSPEIDRVQQHGPDVDQIKPFLPGHLGNHLALADARRSPDKNRLLNVDQVFQCFNDARGVHVSPV